MLRNQSDRWAHYLGHVATGTTFWPKPRWTSPYPPTHISFHDPDWDINTSSYTDINFIFNQMRQMPAHASRFVPTPDSIRPPATA